MFDVTAQTVARPRKRSFQHTLRVMWDYRWIYLMLLPCLAYFIIFKYVPMYGIQLAFKDFKLAGIAASPWNNFEHFKYMMSEPQFLPALRNTLIIVVVSVPITCIFSLWVASAIVNMPSWATSIFRVIFYLPVVTGSVAVTVV